LALIQSKKLRELKHAKIGSEFVSIRAAMQYIATCTRPDLGAPCQLLASRVGDNAPHSVYKTMNKLVYIARETAQDGLRFVPLDLETVRVLFSDATFSIQPSTSHSLDSSIASLTPTIMRISYTTEVLNANVSHGRSWPRSYTDSYWDLIMWYSGIPAREKREHDEVTRL
jgi:hypothetical protein